MLFETIVEYQRARYLWVALGLVVLALALFVSQGEQQPPNGGTWQGYVLGSVGALLIVWLTLLGVRKRRYRSRLGSVQGWVSAHVYLGTALLIVATLHSAAQIGWNVHSLAYGLMVVVIVSGWLGLTVYARYPRLLSDNRVGRPREELFGELFELNERGLNLASACDPEVQALVRSSIERTAVGGGVIAQLLARDASQLSSGASETDSVILANPDQQVCIDFVAERIPRANKAGEAQNLQNLLSVVCRRQTILRRIRRDIQLQGLLQIWLYVHVPLTIALVAALAVHVLTTFLYW